MLFACASFIPHSRLHRQLSHILENRIQVKERLKKQDEWRYRGRMEQLISRGVSSGHAALLPRDPAEPLPTPIREDLAVIEERRGQEELEKRKARAKEMFESQWLQNTEKELQGVHGSSAVQLRSRNKSFDGGTSRSDRRQTCKSPPKYRHS